MKRITSLVLMLLPLLALGANLVPNSGFEIGLRRGWTYISATGSTPLDSLAESVGPWQTVTNAGYAGSSAAKMAEGGFLFSRPILLAAGSYKASFYLRSDVAKGNEFRWGIVPYSTAKNPIVTNNAPSVTTAWVRQSYTYTAPSNGMYAFCFSWWQNGQVAFFPQIDNVLLESGTSLNSWAPQLPIEAGLVVTNYGGEFFSDSWKSLKVSLDNSTAYSSNVVYELRFLDDYNRTVQTTVASAVAASGLSSVNVSLPARNGWLRVLLRTDTGADDETSVTILPHSSTYAASVGTNAILGAHVHSSKYHAQKAAKLSPWSRSLMAKYISRMEVVNPATNTWVWADDQVDNQATNGLTIFGCLAAGLDGQYPSWADDGGHMGEAAWTNFVYNVVMRYGPAGRNRIHRWELLNEPNHFVFFNSPSNYARLMDKTVTAILAADPNAFLVGIGGVGDGGNADWASNALYYAAPATVSRLNAISFHLYPQSGINPPNADDRAYDHWPWFALWKNTAMPLKECWNTESGQWMGPGMRGRNVLYPGIYDLFTSPAVELDRGATDYRLRMAIDNCAKTFVRSIGWGFKKYFYYDARAFRGDNQTSTANGSEQWDDTLQPHFATQVSCAWLLDHGAGLGSVTNASAAGLESYLFLGRDGRAVLAAWCADMRERDCVATNGSFGLFDHWGNLLQTNSASFRLGRTPKFLVSGTLTTNQLKATFQTATASLATDTNAPWVVVDVAPVGSYASGDFNLAKWSAVDDSLVPYSGSASQQTNIVYRWKLDSGSYSGYSQSNHVWLSPSAGLHTLYVSAKDTNGNVREVSYDFAPAVVAGSSFSTVSLTNVTFQNLILR